MAVRITVIGTHEGAFQGIPPTGRRVEVQTISVLHFSEGRVVERWNQLDQLGMLQQLGVLPAPGGA
jgi:predicted ester cyclase